MTASSLLVAPITMTKIKAEFNPEDPGSANLRDYLGASNNVASSGALTMLDFVGARHPPYLEIPMLYGYAYDTVLVGNFEWTMFAANGLGQLTGDDVYSSSTGFPLTWLQMGGGVDGTNFDIKLSPNSNSGGVVLAAPTAEEWHNCNPDLVISIRAQQGDLGNVAGLMYIKLNTGTTVMEYCGFDIKAAGGPKKCFSGDTAIWMNDNTTKPIKEVQIGDIILVFDIEKQEHVEEVVEEITTHDYRKMYTISFVDGVPLNISDDHPLYTRDKGWASINPWYEYIEGEGMQAKIEVGDCVLERHGTWKEIESIVELAYPWKVYTLGNSRYYAGDYLAM